MSTECIHKPSFDLSANRHCFPRRNAGLRPGWRCLATSNRKPSHQSENLLPVCLFALHDTKWTSIFFLTKKWGTAISYLGFCSDSTHSTLQGGQDKDVVQNSVKCFAQVHVDVFSWSFLTYQRSNSVTEGHEICQAQFALSEAMWAVTSHVLIFHVP